MALSYVTYPADGVTTQYDITFGYLARSHVFVFVDDQLRSFRWVTGNRVELNLAPDPGQEVKLQRLTDRVTRIADFSDGQTLLAGDLDAGDLQNFYIVQELLDEIYDGVITGTVPVRDPGSDYVTTQWIQEQLEDNQLTSQAFAQLLQRITDEEVARAQAVSAEAAARANALADEAIARAAAIANLDLLVDTNYAEFVSENTARQTENANTASSLAALLVRMGDAETAIVDEQTARASADGTLAQDLTALTGRTETAEASLVNLNQAITAETGARTSQVSAANSRIDDVESSVTSLATTQADDNAARVQDITAATAATAAAQADATNALNLVASEEAARISEVNALQTAVDGAQASADDVSVLLSSEVAARSTQMNTFEARLNDTIKGSIRYGATVHLDFSDLEMWNRYVYSDLSQTGEPVLASTVVSTGEGPAFAPGLFAYVAARDYVKTEPNEKIKFRIKCFSTSTSAGSGMRLYLYRFSDAKNYQGFSLPIYQSITSADGVIELEGEYEVPSNCHYVWPYVYVGGAGQHLLSLQWERDSATGFAKVTELSDALATGTSSQARLFLGVNTSNNEAFIEQYAGEGDGVWNGSKIKFVAGSFEFSGDVIVDGTITADNLAPNTTFNRVVATGASEVTLNENAWTVVRQVTLASSGAATDVQASGEIFIGQQSGSPRWKWRIRRNSTVLYESREKRQNYTDSGFLFSDAEFGRSLADTPATGANVYYLEVFHAGNGEAYFTDQKCANASLTVNHYIR